jgi:hypothetical protein
LPTLRGRDPPERSAAARIVPVKPGSRALLPAPTRQIIRERTLSMHSIIYLVGLIVIVLALLSLVGLA